MTGLWLVSYIALWLLFLIVAVVLLGVLRNLGVMYQLVTPSPTATSAAPTNLVTGNVVPELVLQTLTGEPISVTNFQGKKTAFTIVSSHCGPCHELLKKIAKDDIAPDPFDPAVLQRIIVNVGTPQETNALFDQVQFRTDTPVLIDLENLVAQKWGITSTPTTVIVNDQLRDVRSVKAS